MSVASILDRKGRSVVTVARETSLAELCDVLATRKIGAVVVVEDGDRIVGILSERDIVRAIARDGAKALGAPAGTYMTADVITAQERETTHQVMLKMTAGRFRHLPVARDGRLVGLISIGDVVKRRIEEAEREAEEMRAYISAA